jgi:hypothetical protein
MKHSRHITIFLVALSFLFVLVLLLLYLNNLKTSSPITAVIPTEVPASTADWKSYKNTEYKIKYPSGLKLSDGKNILSLNNNEFSLTIKKTSLSDNKSWIQEITEKNSQGDPSVAVNITRGLIIYQESRQSSGSTFERNVFIDTGKTIYWMTVSSNNLNPGFSYQNVEKLTDQILSTFETTDIKTGPDKYDGRYVSKSGNFLVIETTSMGLTEISGEAYWKGNLTTNEGKIMGDLYITDNKAEYNNNGCVIDFEFNQNIITAREKDNSTCGGLNVTFDGEYSRE